MKKVFYDLKFFNIRNIIQRDNIIQSFVDNFSFLILKLEKFNINYEESSNKLNIIITFSSNNIKNINNGIKSIESLISLWSKNRFIVSEEKENIFIKHINMNG